MKKAAIYTRFSSDQGLDPKSQQDELIAKRGNTHEIVGEHRDIASGSQGVGDRPGLNKLLEDAAKGEFDMLICTDLTRLTRQLSSEILAALNQVGVRVVTAGEGEFGLVELVARTFKDKTFVENLSERTKKGKRAARERRKTESAVQSNDGSQ